VALVLVLHFRVLRHNAPKHELTERQLTANPAENSISSAAISRDGKYLAYTDFSNKLYLLAIDSGEIRQVPLPGAYSLADWFPDGNHLLLMSKNDDRGLWKVSTWDSSLRKLWDGNGFQSAVSPDGSHVALVNDSREIWLMGGDGEEPRKILAGGSLEYWAIAWSPAGQRLAYIHTQGTYEKHQASIETCDLAGGANTVVLSNPDLWSADGISGILWLPDGRIAYSLSSKGSEDANLWTMAADPGTGKQSGDPIRLAVWKNFQAWNPGASADGKRLIAARYHTESRIYLGDLGNKDFTPRRFSPDSWYDFASDWTRDSKAILFTSRRNGKWAIFEQQLDAHTPETLIAGPENYLRPKLSAQGTILYTARQSSNDDRRLMSTPEHGGARLALMTGGYTYACGSAPSSSCVVVELKDNQLLFSYLDPLKGKGKEIASIAGYKSPEPRWGLSPDGARIAIADPAGEKGEIQILDLADGKTTALPIQHWKWNAVDQISWAADGKNLFALAQSPSSIALLSIDANGNPRVLQEMPSGAGWVSGIVPSPDGRSLAFTRRIYVDDIMLLENF
jgi:Tol biopolymer transport system component